MTASADMSARELPSEESLLAELTRDVFLNDEAAYPELERALRVLICKIQGLECAGQPSDWPQVVAEAISLRPVHG